MFGLERLKSGESEELARVREPQHSQTAESMETVSNSPSCPEPSP